MVYLASTILQTFKVYVKVGFAARGFVASLQFVCLVESQNTYQHRKFMSLYLIVSRYKIKKISKIFTTADMVDRFYPNKLFFVNIYFYIACLLSWLDIS